MPYLPYEPLQEREVFGLSLEYPKVRSALYGSIGGEDIGDVPGVL